MLFADVVGSMDLAERLDPDELTQIMTGLVAVCRDAVERFGGTLDKFTGDGVMALFGAPLAQEDHARRACHAALALLDGAAAFALTLRQRDIDLRVRVGLNSGEVVAGSVAEAFTAIGHTVGLAQRMESAATPGTAYLSEHTAALVGDDVVLRALGKTDVKGSTLPVAIFALDAIAGGSASPARRRSGSARLVGRDEEFALLRSLLGQADEGRAHVVGLVAEAGAGKSRLCDELAAHAVSIGITVRRTAGVSHAQTVPLLPILGLFRDYFAINTDDDPSSIRAQLSRRVLNLDPTLEPELGLLFDFLEVADPLHPAPQLSADARRRRILSMFRRLAARRSEHQTLLLVLEDLHWFDSQSIAFLEGLLPNYPGTRTLVVTNFRPEFHASWTARSYYRQIPLAPLDGPSVNALLGELLGPGADLGELGRQILKRAGGNPFFVEELVRGLAMDGTLAGLSGAYELARPADQVRIPPTVQAVLAARIDRLDERAKSTLQGAAVIGRTFTAAVLAMVTGQTADTLDDALHTLCSTELIQGAGPPEQYQFWHPLTHEVTYGTLLAATRQRHHRAVADALISFEPARHDELATLIATHFDAGEDHLEAARWQLRAGIRASRNDFAEARRLSRSTLEHLSAAPTTDDALALGVRARSQLLRIGGRTGAEPGEADQLLAQAHPAAQHLADPALLTGLSSAAGSAKTFSGDITGGLASYREADCYADLGGDDIVRAHCRFALSFTLLYTGPLDEGLTMVADVFDLCGGDPLTGIAHSGFSFWDAAHIPESMLLATNGQLVAAQERASRALALYEQRPAAEWHAWLLSHLAHLLDRTGESGEIDAADAAAQRALVLATESGNIAAAAKARQSAGVVALLRGLPEVAAATLGEALVIAREHRSGLLEEASLLAHLARAHLARADSSAARATADEAVSVAQRQGAHVAECFAHLIRSRVYRETATSDADLAEARAAADAGDALAAETGALTYAAFLAEERARLEPDAAAQLAGLKLAADAYTAIGATGHARRLHDELRAGG